MSSKENKKLESEKNDGTDMSFLDHLEELRWRLMYSIGGVLIGTIAAWIFIDFLVDGILLRPARDAGIKLQNLQPFGQLFLYFQIALIAGLLLSIPNVFYHIWKFIGPALRDHEKRYAFWVVAFSSGCFLAGVAFAYYGMLPLTLKFAAQFGSTAIENNFAVSEYFSIIISVMLAAGLIFELPMMSFFLSKIGLLKPQHMRKFRKHSIIAILLAAAILTPGTDPVAQLVLAVPLVILYEISIFVSKFSQKKRIEEES